MSTGAYSVVWTRWYTTNMSNAILPHTLAVFTVDSALVSVTTYDRYMAPRNTMYRRDGIQRHPATSIIRSHVYTM